MSVAMPISTPLPADSATDALAWLLENKEDWPREIALVRETYFPVVFEGRVAGSSRMPPGAMVKLIEWHDELATIASLNGVTRVAIASTDLRERAEQALAKAIGEPLLTTAPKTVALVPGSSGPTILQEKRTEVALANSTLTLAGSGALHLTGTGDPLPGSMVNFTSPDAWLFLENVRPSVVASTLLNRLRVNGAPAALGTNVRLAQFDYGCVVIPQGPDFGAMQVFEAPSLGGASKALRCGVKYDDVSLGAMQTSIGSFRLKRGYTATIAQNANGTGISKNYVAQDYDLDVKDLPPGLDQVRFVRVFPWRWVSKKGVSGDIWQNLNVGWYYDWNISHNSTLDLEYMPIRQSRGWPGLDQDWIARGACQLLGYNEPDHKDQSNLTVDEAIASWPDLLATGLRVGTPATSDGGLNWLYQFVAKADAAHLRVDFVAMHYYRAVNEPANAQGAASQFYNYLKGIHDRVKRPLWVTEWNNGANWTGHKPNAEQEKAAVEEMVKMLDRTPWVERYAIYNWVEDTRFVQRKDGTLTPAGEVYRNEVSPISYTQARP